MIDKIRTQEQYEAIMKMIEKYIQKATKMGGFHALSKQDEKELSRLTLLANDYEKKIHAPRGIPDFTEPDHPKQVSRNEHHTIQTI